MFRLYLFHHQSVSSAWPTVTLTFVGPIYVAHAGCGEPIVSAHSAVPCLGGGLRVTGDFRYGPKVLFDCQTIRTAVRHWIQLGEEHSDITRKSPRLPVIGAAFNCILRRSDRGKFFRLWVGCIGWCLLFWQPPPPPPHTIRLPLPSLPLRIA